MCVERLRPVAQRVDAALLRSLDADARVPHHPGRLRHQLGFRTGVVPPELEDEMLVLLLLGALGHDDQLVVLGVLVAGVLRGHPERRHRRHEPLRQIGHLVEPLPPRERLVGVQVVRLPEGAAVGRDRDAAQLDLVADHPRGHGDHSEDRDRDRGDPAGTAPGDEDGEDHGKGEQARIGEDGHARDDAQRDAEPRRPAGDRQQRQPEHRGAEQLVEDLAVSVDVVPDEVGLERRDHGGDQADPRAQEPPSGLEDDDRSADGDQDLHRPHRPPVEAGDPEDRDQEPAVERLGVGRRVARDVAEGAVAEIELREDVRLLEVAQDRGPLVHEHDDPRHRADGDHDRIGEAASHAPVTGRRAPLARSRTCPRPKATRSCPVTSNDPSTTTCGIAIAR